MTTKYAIMAIFLEGRAQRKNLPPYTIIPRALAPFYPAKFYP
jgi:hypothetical protein